MTRRTAALAIGLAAAVMLTSSAAASNRNRSKTVAATKVVCGQTGCFEVKSGCSYEMRRSGRGGVVAVVWCDKK